MRALLAGCLLAAASIGWAQPSGAQADDPAAILNAASSVYHGASSLQLKGVKVREQHDDFVDEVRRTPFELLLMPDNRFRQESMIEGGPVIQVCDGERHWSYSPQTNKFSSAAGTPNPTILFDTAVDLRYLTDGLVSAKLLRQESLGAGGAQHFCDVIEAHYERPHQSATTEFGDVVFWLDHQSHLIWKTRMPVSLQVSAAGARSSFFETTLYSDVRMNQDLPASAFTFTPPPGSSEQTAATDGRTSLMGRSAPDFKLRALDGTSTQLSALKGQVVLLDFWATWCGPCRMTMPKLDSLSRKFKKQDVAVMGIDDNENEQTVRDFIQKNHYEYPILLSARADGVLESYGVHGLPTMVVIDKNGLVADYKVGYGHETEDSLRADLVRILGADYVAPKPAATSGTAQAGAVTALDNWPEPKTADEFLRRGNEQQRLHNYARAIADASAALQLKPDWAPGLRLRARAEYEAKDYNAAIQDDNVLLQQHPDWPQVHDARGLAYSYSGHHELAIPDYTEAIKLDPYLSEPYNNRGWAYLESGNIPLAVQDLNRALELAPEFARAHENRAKAFDKQGDLQSELIDLEDLMRLAPENQWARDQHADVVKRLGEAHQAAAQAR
jgi:peroxiredoxin/outer membrane lipoprotein-sorting protein